MDEANIIDENDTVLNVVGYFNVDHKFEWWMSMLMNILLYFLPSCFAIMHIFEVSTQVVDYIGQLSWLIMHGINFLFSIL
jgi:hypothetical protein